MRLLIGFSTLALFFSVIVFSAQAQLSDIINFDKAVEDIKNIAQSEDNQTPEQQQKAANSKPKQETHTFKVSNIVPTTPKTNEAAAKPKDPFFFASQYVTQDNRYLVQFSITLNEDGSALDKGSRVESGLIIIISDNRRSGERGSTMPVLPSLKIKRRSSDNEARGVLTIGKNMFEIKPYSLGGGLCRQGSCKFKTHADDTSQNAAIVNAIRTSDTLQFDLYHSSVEGIVYTFKNTIDKASLPKAIQEKQAAQNVENAASMAAYNKAQADHAAQDPLYNLCNDNITTQTYYDCNCVLNTANETHRDKAQEKIKQTTAKQNDAGMQYEEIRLKKWQDKAVEANPPSQSLLDAIEDQKNKIAAMKNNSNVKKATVNDVFRLITEEGLCKNAEGVKQLNVEECEKSGSSDVNCKCVGDEAASMWLKEKNSLNSGVIVNISTMARSKCR